MLSSVGRACWPANDSGLLARAWSGPAGPRL